jgi:hypothetical protein
MARLPSTEEVQRRRVMGCLEAFVEGKRDLKWIKGVIRWSGVLERKGELQEIFDELRFYENVPRYWEIFEE